MKFILFFLAIFLSAISVSFSRNEDKAKVKLISRGENYNIDTLSLTYLTGDAFRYYCDFIFDERFNDIDVTKMKEGCTIFVKTDNLDAFFQTYHSQIPCGYVMVSHNSDYPVSERYLPYLNDDKLLAWFGQNIETSHPKLHPIPIGLENPYLKTTRSVEEMRQRVGERPRSFFVYMNFALSTFPERSKVFRLFENIPYCHKVARRPFLDYLFDLTQTFFVLSPRGNGLDCHRTWEALYLGAIPIVKSSEMDAVFEGLPVLIIKEWEEITEEFLHKKYQEIGKKPYQLEKLFMPYWVQRINGYKPS